MARKRHSDEDILKLLREIELKLTAGDDVASACRGVGSVADWELVHWTTIPRNDATYYNWRKRFGGWDARSCRRLRALRKSTPG